jgi:hypothetical protein
MGSNKYLTHSYPLRRIVDKQEGAPMVARSERRREQMARLMEQYQAITPLPPTPVALEHAGQS